MIRSPPGDCKHDRGLRPPGAGRPAPPVSRDASRPVRDYFTFTTTGFQNEPSAWAASEAPVSTFAPIS